MFRLTVSRLLGIIPVLVLAATLTFSLMHLGSSDPAAAIVGESGTQEQIDTMRTQLGLDKPFVTQYADWVKGAVHGDLGDSYFTNQPVSGLLWDALPVTVSLMVGGIVVAILIGIPAGVWSATRAGRVSDRAMSGVVTIGLATPSFWLAMMLIWAFALRLDWFPAIGYVPLTDDPLGWLQSIALPSLALGCVAAASVARQTRSSLIGVLQLDYIRTALAKGLSRRQVIVHHALKNASSPVLTILAFQVSALLGGAVVVERLFVLPGLGTVAVNAVTQHDLPVVLGVVVVAVIIVVFVNLLLDISYALVNPKIRPS